jgi:hypothetical protein
LLFAGKPHIVLQHTNVEPGGFMLEDTLLLIEAMKDLSPEALVQTNLVCLLLLYFGLLQQMLCSVP